MKARLITIGESEIRQRVEEEYQKKKDQIYESVIKMFFPSLCPFVWWNSIKSSDLEKSDCGLFWMA